ncbi:serine threonine- phosphatase PGAM5, mitochondrial isoform X2 [Pelobates cultripes]|uniref:Serine/threonine-protein phosphatase PGAM5, mitochondrial n=1 Tax=Pelobates cultripes TaxID=61616 RepID=A0AAD1T930_PELCU|nr:serine threonine- phosphatase PGAM5, mitochondrial isoform X2 [Pelobates cultripes]
MFLRRAVIAFGGSAFAVFAAVGKSGDDSGFLCPPIIPGRWDWNWDCREPMSLINLKHLEGCTEKEQVQLFQEPKSWVFRSQSRRQNVARISAARHGASRLRLSASRDKLMHQNSCSGYGREQASLTGQRLALLASEGNNFSCIIYSSLTRSTETADIISKNLPGIKMCSSSLLHEGPPIRPVPAESKWIPELSYFKDGPRIEAAFRKYIHRADPEQTKDSYEIIVCHDNVIRYFVCRALQLPPEAWLRMSLYHGSITKLVIKPDGDVSLKMLGDAGFMPPRKLTGA